MHDTRRGFIYRHCGHISTPTVERSGLLIDLPSLCPWCSKDTAIASLAATRSARERKANALRNLSKTLEDMFEARRKELEGLTKLEEQYPTLKLVRRQSISLSAGRTRTKKGPSPPRKEVNPEEIWSEMDVSDLLREILGSLKQQNQAGAVEDEGVSWSEGEVDGVEDDGDPLGNLSALEKSIVDDCDEAISITSELCAERKFDEIS